MDSIDKIKELCTNKLNELNLSDEKYLDRLSIELKELKDFNAIKTIDKAKELLGLLDSDKIPYNTNRSNSIILFLLGISSIDPIDNELYRSIKNKGTDFPDIDLDFIPEARIWVKDHIFEVFGNEHVCSIGTYQTYKTKAVIIDCARALGLDVWEANQVTKVLDSLATFDVGDGDDAEEMKIDDMSFEEIFKIYPDVEAYAIKYPEVINHAAVLRNQVKNMSKHAGGMIISDLDLRGRIPVLKDKDEQVISAWTEGMSTHELSAVGLVKFDILGLCLEENTLINTDKGAVPIKYLDGTKIQYLNNNGEKKYTDDFLLIDSGKKDLIEIILEDSSKVKCSPNHKFFVEHKDKCKVSETKDLNVDDYILTDSGYKKIASIESIGEGNCYDISLLFHNDLFINEENFVLSNGIVSHNSNLSIIDDCLGFIEQTHGIKIKKEDIDIDNKEAIRESSKNDMVGIFQFEATATKPIADAVRMENIHDIAAVTSLLRPGPRTMGMDKEYADRKHLRKQYSIPDCLKDILGETYGVICIHEDTRISTIDGGSLPIKEMKKDIGVYSYDYNGNIVPDICDGARQTKRCDGLKLTLDNGYSVTLTNDHKVLTFDGMKEVQDLSIENDIICCAVKTHIDDSCSSNHFEPFGDNNSFSYFLGMIIGDAQCDTSVELCCGDEEKNADILSNWIDKNLNNIIIKKYFHCRSYYLRIRSDILVNDKKYGNRKKLFCKLLEDLEVRFHTCYNKIVPEVILKDSTDDMKLAFLAGLIDSDGCITDRSCFITSVSNKLLDGVQDLLRSLGAKFTLAKNRVYIYDSNFNDRVNKYLVLKTIDFAGDIGSKIGICPTTLLRNKIEDSNMSIKEYCEKNKLSKGTLYREHCCTGLANKFGVDFGDVLYFKIRSIDKVEDQIFYGMSVRENHNLIANGIMVRNCYQEQTMKIAQELAGFTGAESNKLRKFLVKEKDPDVLESMKHKFIKGSKPRIDSGEVTEEEVIQWWNLIHSFSGYGFNKSLVINSLITTVYDGKLTSKSIQDFKNGDIVLSYNIDKDKFEEAEVLDIHDHGELEGFEVEFDDGSKEICSMNHKFLTKEGQKPLHDIMKKDLDILSLS